MNDLDHICENYKVCWYREMCLPDNQRCPHVVSHDHYPACDWECDKVEVHCKEIVLKGNEWKILVIGYPIIARLIHGQVVDNDTHKVCLIPDDQLMNEHQRIVNSPKKEE